MYVIFLVLSLLGDAWGYGSGAPSSTCRSMYPAHGSDSKAVSTSPYHIMVDKTRVSPGDSVTVTLTGDMRLKGFMVQARRPGDDAPLGRFNNDDRYKLMSCGGGVDNTMTHSNRNRKQTVTLIWTPDDTDEGQIVFRATFVKSAQTFWVGVESEILTIESRGRSDASEGSQTEDLPSLCGNTFTCLGVGCQGQSYRNCRILSGYRKILGEDKFEVKLVGKTNGYVAIGFSDDLIMADDSVVECVNEDGQIMAYKSYNKPGTKANQRLGKMQQTGISNVSGSHVDGVLRCSFTLDAVVGLPTSAVNDLTKQQVHVLVAAGITQPDGIQYHTVGRVASATKAFLQ